MKTLKHTIPTATILLVTLSVAIMMYAWVTDQRREEVADKLARNPQRFRI